MNVATDFVLVKPDGWGVLLFFVRKGTWTTDLSRAKVFPTREKAEAKLNSYIWPSVKYMTVDEAKAELGK